MPTNNLAPKTKNKLGIASSIPPKMSERFGSAVSPYLQSVQGLFPPANPYGQALSNFLLGQAPQAAQRMAEGYPNVLFDTRNPLGGNRIVNPVALDMAAALPVATALKGAGLAKGGVAATFAGIGAKTANREALLVAERMKAAGAPDEEIYKATGWFFGSADGKPRFEIDDSGAQAIPFDKLKQWYLTEDVKQGNPLSGGVDDFLSHPELEKTYDGVMNFGDSNKRLSLGVNSESQGGSFADGHITVGAEGNAINKSTTLHELQHAIQQREGFARGGSPEGMTYEALKGQQGAIVQKMLKNMDSGLPPDPRLDNELKQIDSLIREFQTTGSSGFTGYKRLAGEAEARLTQSRMDMTGAERAASYPPSMYDVPVGDQIVRYGDGAAMSVPNMTEGELRHQTAQRNAALPVEQGGLGLAAGNTAVERAAAMDFKGNLYHGGTNDFSQFNVSPRTNVYATDEPRIADIYAQATGRHKALREINAGPNVIPLMYSGKLAEVSDQGLGGGGWYRENLAKQLGVENTRQIIKNLPDTGHSGLKITNMDDLGGTQNQYLFPDPSVLRARTAAFDPFRRNAAIAAAMGVAAPDLLADERQSPESQAIARYREIKGPKSVVRMEAALRTAGVPLPKNEPVAYIQGLVDRAHKRN